VLPAGRSPAGFPVVHDGATLQPKPDAADRARTSRWWGRRRTLGEPLNVVRLVRAAATFDGAMRYVAWKVERHTGMPVKVTPLRERFPVLAAPALAVHLWRSKRRNRS